MIDAQSLEACRQRLSSARVQRATFARTHALTPCFARSSRERLAVECLRLLLAAREDADISLCAGAYDRAEALLARRAAVEFVRTIASIAHILRRARVSGFRFLRDEPALLTQDECSFLAALQSAIDGSPVGLSAAAHMLAQSGDAHEIAVEIHDLAHFALHAEA